MRALIEVVGSRRLDCALTATLALVQAVLATRPRREHWVHQSATYSARRVVLASDAAYEAGRGSAGFLLVQAQRERPSQLRLGRALIVDPALFQLWGPQVTYIAQLELVVVLSAMVLCAQLLRGSPFLVFIDNVAALMALVNGSSRSPSLDLMATFVHAACFALKAIPYFEYVESGANWSDEISREGLRGRWASARGFHLDTFLLPAQLLSLPYRAVLAVFEFL